MKLQCIYCTPEASIPRKCSQTIRLKVEGPHVVANELTMISVDICQLLQWNISHQRRLR